MKKSIKKIVVFLLMFSVISLLHPNVTYAETTNGDEADNNDKPANATVLNSAEAVTGILSSGDDVDYYKYTVDVTGHYSFAFKNNAAQDGIWYLYVYDSSLKQLEYDIISDYSYTTRTYNFKKGSVLYVKVANQYGATGKEYSVNVNAASDSKWEQEKDDSFSKSDKLNYNSDKLGNLYYGDDVDYYTYTAAKTGALKVKFKFDTAEVGCGWKVAIYNSAKKQIETERNVTSDKTIRFKAIKGKKYYVVVSAENSFSTTNGVVYTLKIK